jgi:hypothetical protein
MNHKFISCRLMFVIIFLAFFQSLNAQTFHAIFVADTKDSTIGPSCQKDLIDMNLKIAKVASSLRMSYNPMVISENRFGRIALDSAINVLQCSPNDVIFYLYSGHGYAVQDRPNLFPLMMLKDDNNFGLDEVHLKLKLKNARLCVTLGDCCSEISPKVLPPIIQPIDTRGIDVIEDFLILSQLFAKTDGDVLICSTQKGELAAGQKSYGGFYTYAWLEALEFAEKTNNDITWESFLNDSKNRFDLLVNTMFYNQPLDKPRQTPQWQINNKKTTIIDPTPNPKPKPVVSFDELNAFLNQLADESQPFESRSALRNTKKESYFNADAQIQIFIDNPDKPLETQPLSKFLSRLMLNAKLIRQVNTIEKRSTLGDGGKYKILTVQEVR